MTDYPVFCVVRRLLLVLFFEQPSDGENQRYENSRFCCFILCPKVYFLNERSEIILHREVKNRRFGLDRTLLVAADCGNIFVNVSESFK